MIPDPKAPLEALLRDAAWHIECRRTHNTVDNCVTCRIIGRLRYAAETGKDTLAAVEPPRGPLPPLDGKMVRAAERRAFDAGYEPGQPEYYAHVAASLAPAAAGEPLREALRNGWFDPLRDARDFLESSGCTPNETHPTCSGCRVLFRIRAALSAASSEGTRHG